MRSWKDTVHCISSPDMSDQYSKTMLITVNNKPKELSVESPSVDELLQLLGLRDSGTAIAINGNIIRKDARRATFLKEGDDVIIFTAAFGG